MTWSRKSQSRPLSNDHTLSYSDHTSQSDSSNVASCKISGKHGMDRTLMKDAQIRSEMVENILAALNSHKVRATYSAVGELLGILAQSVGVLLGQNRPYASWVVSRGTKSPTGYSLDHYHRDLYLHSKVIDSASELEALLRGDHDDTEPM